MYQADRTLRGNQAYANAFLAQDQAKQLNNGRRLIYLTRSLKGKQMKSTLWQRTICAAGFALAMAVPAHATLVTFENVSPSAYFLNDTYVSGAFTFTLANGLGVIDTSAAFGPGFSLDLAVPRGNATQFFIGLNDARLNMRATDNSAFRLAGFDFGFVSALAQLFSQGESAGLMLAAYETGGGALGTLGWDFGAADAYGEFSFRSLGLSDMGALASGVRQIDFFACTYDVALTCANPNVNFGQFAVDNFRIPEPHSLALALLALGIVGGLRVRRSN